MEDGQRVRIRDDTVICVFIKGKFAGLVLGLARREFEPDCFPRLCLRVCANSKRLRALLRVRAVRWVRRGKLR